MFYGQAEYAKARKKKFTPDALTTSRPFEQSAFVDYAGGGGDFVSKGWVAGPSAVRSDDAAVCFAASVVNGSIGRVAADRYPARERVQIASPATPVSTAAEQQQRYEDN